MLEELMKMLEEAVTTILILSFNTKKEQGFHGNWVPTGSHQENNLEPGQSSHDLLREHRPIEGGQSALRSFPVTTGQQCVADPSWAAVGLGGSDTSWSGWE